MPIRYDAMMAAGRSGSNAPGTSRAQEHSRERGASAVEFALVAPILIMLVLGIIQFSIAYNDLQGVHAAAREGARYGSLPTTDQGEIETRVNEALDGVPMEAPPDIQVSYQGGGSCQDADTVKVVVIATFKVIPFWVPYFDSATVTGKGEFRCE
jgi:hypothetical protein